MLAGCAAGDGSAGTTTSPTPSASSTSAGATASSSTTSSAEPSDEVLEVTVAVRDGKVRPRARRVEVEKGSDVRLVVTSDVRDEVHVHGYDLDLQLRPGKPGTLEFRADQDGVFEVETHETGLELLQLAVR